MPTLEATIISPDDGGHQLGCRGHTSVSNFDGVGCKLTLHHCRRASEDVVFPLALHHGLLFAEALTPPSSDPNRCGPAPQPTLHVRKVSKATCDASASDDAHSAVSAASAASAAHASDCSPSALSAASMDPPDPITPVVEAVVDEGADDESSAGSVTAKDAVDMFPGTSRACSCAEPSACSCDGTTGPVLTDLPFDCSCCCLSKPVEEPLSLSLEEKMLLFQHLGSQLNAPLEGLHLHALGALQWPPGCPSVCGHSHPCTGAMATAHDDATGMDADPVVDADTGCGAPELMEPGEERALCHLSCDQLCLLWHQ